MLNKLISLTLIVLMVLGLFAGCKGGDDDKVDVVESVSFDKQEITLTVGEKADIYATVLPEEAEDAKLVWESSDESVATVSRGRVKAISVGTAFITATSENGKYAICYVTVKEKEVEDPDGEDPDDKEDPVDPEKPGDENPEQPDTPDTPEIPENLDQALSVVMPNATGFNKINLSSIQNLPSTVTDAYVEKSGKGYAVLLETTGYRSGLVILVGISSDGIITGATCLSSNETFGYEKTFGDKTVGKDIDTIVDVEAGATSLTINGYRGAVEDALYTVEMLNGGSSDTPDTPDNPDTPDEDEDPVEVGSNVGNKRPAYSLSLVDGSGEVNVNDFLGKKVVINFWGTWCGPCKQELPDFDEIATDYDGEVVVLAIHTSFSSAGTKDYIEENYSSSNIIFAYDVPMAEYTDTYYTMLGGDNSYPRTVIIDEKGIILFTKVGMTNYNEIASVLGPVPEKPDYEDPEHPDIPVDPNPGVDVDHTLTITTEGGMAISNLPVYVFEYENGQLGDMVSYGTTDNEGRIKITLNSNGSYAVRSVLMIERALYFMPISPRKMVLCVRA